jgi:IclR family KDG regulon transcriptional repressor
MPEISKTADQALKVLITVAERGPITPAELAAELGLNRTVIHRLLATLHGRGFIVRLPDGYGPGAVLLSVADRVQPELRRTGKAVIRELAREIGETVVMHVPEGDAAVVLEQSVPECNLVRVEHAIGARNHIASGPSGQAILAFLDDAMLQRLMGRDQRTRDAHPHLDQVRRLGYALSRDEVQNGVQGLAVPVRAEANGAVASMTIIVPDNRADRLHEYVDQLLAASGSLSDSLSTVAG